jgi:2-oxoglutarate dehydrogenase E2 component (dihydrolipoamide succinyltransferase)
MKTLIFRTGSVPYNAGERAGFEDAVAEKLVEAGVAAYIAAEAEPEPEPEPAQPERWAVPDPTREEVPEAAEAAEAEPAVPESQQEVDRRTVTRTVKEAAVLIDEVTGLAELEALRAGEVEGKNGGRVGVLRALAEREAYLKS